MTAQPQPAAVRGAATVAKDGASSLTLAGGASNTAAPGSFSSDEVRRAIYAIAERCHKTGDPMPTQAAMAKEIGCLHGSVVHQFCRLREAGIIETEKHGRATVTVTSIGPYRELAGPPGNTAVQQREMQKALRPSANPPANPFAGIRFEDDPRASRDMGSRGAIPRPAETRSWGGVAEYGR